MTFVRHIKSLKKSKIYDDYLQKIVFGGDF